MVPQNLQTPLHVLHFFLIIAAACATAFPVVYLRRPWYKSALGRVLMLHGVALALALDLTLLFTYWRTTDLRLHIYIDIAVIGLVAGATLGLLVILLRTMKETSSDHSTPEFTFDGTLEVEQSGNKKVYSLSLESDPQQLDQKDFVIFRVAKPQPVGE